MLSDTLIRIAKTAVAFVASAAACRYFWLEAHLPMTAERYARLCDNQPECYPEAGYLLAVAFLYPVAAIVGLILTVDLALLGLKLARSKF